MRTITKSRAAAGALAAGVAATLLVTAPSVPAQAATKVKVKDSVQAKVLRNRVAAVARYQVGDRYALGATGPRAFDCSGLVVYAYKRATGKTLPRTSYAQIDALTQVRKRDRRIGDVVFFRGGGHVGIYVGRNRIVHALNPGAGVRYDRTDSGWSGSSITGYGRVIQVR